MSGVEYITEWPPPEGTVQLQASPPSEGTSVQPSSSNDDETSGRLKRQYHSSDKDIADVKKLKSNTCAPPTLCNDHTLLHSSLCTDCTRLHTILQPTLGPDYTLLHSNLCPDCTILHSSLCTDCTLIHASILHSYLCTDCTILPAHLCTDSTILPIPLLARWWRRNKDKLLPPPFTSSNPRTHLYHIAQLPEAKAILTQRISALKAKLTKLCNTPYEWIVHQNIATCHHTLGSGLEHTAAALYHADQALQFQPRLHTWDSYKAPALYHADPAIQHLDQPSEGEVLWLMEQLVRQRDAEERRSGLEGELKLRGLLTMPTPAQVERRCASGLSVEEFYRCYALTRTPLVITGLVHHMTKTPWTLAYMEQKVGDRIVPLKRMVEGSVEWARLETVGLCSLRKFIHSLDNGKENRYLFDWSLSLHCPELVAELSIPKYFATDFLQRTPEGSLYKDSWPSVFIAPPEVVSELHVDAFGSNFWMALFEGRKRWVFFPPEDTPLLYPIYAHSTDAVFEAHLSSPDLTLHPLLSLTHPRHCTLEPGEVLYVPAGCPHRVENLEKSLAISANFIDCSNLELAKKELSANAFIDYRAQELLDVLTSAEFDTSTGNAAVSDTSTGNAAVSEISTGTASGRGQENKYTSTEDVELCVSWTDFKSQKQH